VHLCGPPPPRAGPPAHQRLARPRPSVRLRSGVRACGGGEPVFERVAVADRCGRAGGEPGVVAARGPGAGAREEPGVDGPVRGGDRGRAGGRARRGGWVALRRPGGSAIVQALIARGVVGGFRSPDILRFGFAPLYLRYVDVYDAARALVEVVTSGEWQDLRFAQSAQVT